MRLFELLIVASSAAFAPALHAQAAGPRDPAPVAPAGTSAPDVWQSALAPRNTAQSGAVFSDSATADSTADPEPGDEAGGRGLSRRHLAFPLVAGAGIYAWATHTTDASAPARKAVRVAPPNGGPGPYDPGGQDVPPPVTATPEPGTVLLLATGLIALIPVMRRRRRA